MALVTKGRTFVSGEVVTPTKLNTLVDSATVTQIVDADISASAAIADTKLATISTAGKVSNSATTATSANTANAIVARDASGNFSAGTVTAALTGNASTATTLQTARTIAISGDVTGTAASFNGSANISIASAITADSIVDADINSAAAIADTKLATISTAGKVSNSATTATSANTASAIVTRDASGGFSAGTITANLTGAVTGNASTATTLQTARTIAISGDVTGTATSFNGSNNITISSAITAASIVTADISDAQITTAKIADANVTTAKIADANVTAAKIADSNVTTAKLANNAVTAAKLGTNEQRQICKAWVNFNGTLGVVSGLAYSRSGTTVTVTWDSHGQANGTTLVVQSATDAGLNNIAYIITVVNSSTFTFQTTSTGATSGTLSVIGQMIRSSYNVSSITKIGAGNFVVNFATPMADSNFTVCGMATDLPAVSSCFVQTDPTTPLTTSSARVIAIRRDNGGGADVPQVYVQVFGN